jgi:hypothetical protein
MQQEKSTIGLAGAYARFHPVLLGFFKSLASHPAGHAKTARRGKSLGQLSLVEFRQNKNDW